MIRRCALHYKAAHPQALRAEDLDNEGDTEYGVTGARGLLASAGIGRSSRSIAASQGIAPSSATGRPSDLASVSSEAHSTVPSLAPATSLAATRRSTPPASPAVLHHLQAT